MRPTHRREAARVIDRLLAAPQEFEFVQAVRILLAWLGEQGVAPEQALRSHLRFANSLRLGFPASDIEALSCEPPRAGGGPALDGEAPRLTLTPAFMGLLGAHGTLPAHLTQRIAAWQAEHDDEAPRAFLDMLSSRMLVLFYRAWHKHRVEHTRPDAGGGLQAMLLALAGAASSECVSRTPALPDGLFAHFAGLLHQRPVSGAVLQRLLADVFAEAVQLEEAVGHWDVLARAEQSALGVNASLGENILLGERSWRPDLRVRLRIGPLGRDMFARFLPGGPAARTLHAILQAVAVPTVGFEVRLILRGRDVTPSRLAGADAAPTRLGRNSFVLGDASAAADKDRADMRYLLVPMAPMAASAPARKNRPVRR